MIKKIAAIFISLAMLAGIVVVAVKCANDNPEEHSHEIYAVAAKEGSCEEDGNIVYYACRTCDKIFSDNNAEHEIEKDSVIVTGHKLKEIAKVGATCTKDGAIAYYECGVCGKKFADSNGKNLIGFSDIIVVATGHTVKRVSAKDMDCRTNTNGNKEYLMCVNEGCGEKFLPCAETEEDAVLLKDENGQSVYGAPAQDADIFEFVSHDYNAEGVCRICGATKDTPSDGLEYFEDLDGKWIVTGRGTCSDKIIFIGGEYGGKEVKGISSAVFFNDTLLTSVIILSDKIEFIDENAFKNCTNLKSVTIAGGVDSNGALRGVREIGKDVFSGCSGVVITYEGSKNEWARISISGDLNAEVLCKAKVISVKW